MVRNWEREDSGEGKEEERMKMLVGKGCVI